ncbi:MAG: hypothetical protein ACT6FF_03890 [Methanosarcinaceae archaeon]
MVLIGPDIFVIVLFIISGLITLKVSSNSICEKSFYQINSDLSKPNQTNEKKIKIISYLHGYIRDYSDEEILIFNFRFKPNNWCSAIFIAIQIIFILAMIKFELSSYNVALIVFLICIGYLFPILLSWMRFGKLGFDKASIQNISYTFINIFMDIVHVLSVFLACISLLLFTIQFVKLKPDSSFFEVFYHNMNFGGLESISSNQLSLAGFCFTFAVGGTIIFSLTSKYLTQKRSINEIILRDADEYEKWFESNKNNLCFNVGDIKKINSDKIKGYQQAISNLRSKLNIDDVNGLRRFVRMYKCFRTLMIVMYLLGIFTILLTQSFMNLLCILFIVCSFFYIVLLIYMLPD